MDRKRYFPVFSAWPQLLCLVITCVMAIAAALALVYLADEPPSEAISSLPALASAQEEQSSLPVPQAKYLMKNHGGRLAVFQPQEDSPLLIFDVYISTLPEYDQQLLQEGIPAEGEEPLTRLIEDYIS